MSRLFSILISLFILFLVYLWINHITKKDNEGPPVITENISKPLPRSADTKSSTGPAAPDSRVKDNNLQSEPSVEDKKPPTKPVATEEPQLASALDGVHLVVAGNFLERTNAEKHLKSIKDLGYNDAEILNFEISEYYTVIAGRYEDLADARRIAKKLKDLHGIDTYVRNGN